MVNGIDDIKNQNKKPRNAKGKAKKHKTLSMDSVPSSLLNRIIGPDTFRMIDGQGASLLKIRVSSSEVDPFVIKALKNVREKFKPNNGVNKLIERIQGSGFSSDISKVTKRLNRMRLSDMRTRILEASYPAILYQLLYGTTKADHKDELGFSNAVLFKLDEKTGPINTYLNKIIDDVQKENHLRLSDTELVILLSRLRKTDMTTKSRKVEPVVMREAERIFDEGVWPGLVEKYIDRGEIDPSQFTDSIKNAMIRHLIKRGVVINDDDNDALDKFDNGEYDEHFRVAYEHAVSAVDGGDDPISAARIGVSGEGLWDFTVDTFDDIEEQGVIADNILAAGALDYIYELGEHLGIFKLVDVLVLNWSSGAIDVVDGPAADKLYRYWKLRDERSTTEERGLVYKRVLNKGNVVLLSRMVANEHFSGLMNNLMSEVASYIEKTERLDEGLSETSPVSKSRIYQATKELQYNLTEYCTGMAHMQAREMYAQLQAALDLLGDEEVIAHFGGLRRKSLWTVIEKLSKSEFGASPNIAAIRALAVYGNEIFQWIANFDGDSSRLDDFEQFLQSAESYILNMAVIDEDVDFTGNGNENDNEDDFEDDSNFDVEEDEFEDF